MGRRGEEGRLLPRLVSFSEVGVVCRYGGCKDGECKFGDGGLSVDMFAIGS